MTKLICTLHKLENWFLVICLLIMGIVLTLQILMRTFFAPLQWAEELSRYLQIWITFLGIGYGVRQGSHISMTLVKDKVPKTIKYIFEMICNIASLVAFIVLIVSSFTFLQHQNVVSTAMKVPMQVVYSVIPIGAIIYMLYNIADCVRITKVQFKKGDQ